MKKRKRPEGHPTGQDRPQRLAESRQQPLRRTAAIPPGAGTPCARQGPAQRRRDRAGQRATAGRCQTLAESQRQPEASTGNKTERIGTRPTRSQGQGIEDQGRRMQAPETRETIQGRRSNGRKARGAAHAPGEQRTRTGPGRRSTQSGAGQAVTGSRSRPIVTGNHRAIGSNGGAVLNDRHRERIESKRYRQQIAAGRC